MGSFSLWHWLIVLVMLAIPAAAIVAVVLFVNSRRRPGKWWRGLRQRSTRAQVKVVLCMATAACGGPTRTGRQAVSVFRWRTSRLASSWR